MEVQKMEVVTLDVINAVINSLKYVNPEKLKNTKLRVALSTMLSKEINEEYSYKIFMAALLKDISSLGQVTISEEPKEKRNRIYKSTEIVRSMPEIIPFQYNIADIILEIEEKLDGSGHPAGKTKIKPEAEIIGIAEDYIKYKNIQALKFEEKYNQEMVSKLENIITNEKKMEIINYPINLEEYISKYLITYNVYKEEIKGVEEEQFLSMIASIIDAKHSYTGGHSKRVAAYSYAIAQELFYSEEKLNEIRYASYLHDIGKLGVDISLLDKDSKLTEEEFEKIKLHAKYSYEILQETQRLKRFAYGALHHERIDGKGYPFGLKGDEIPEGAKIIAVADILDALTSNRSYRKPFTFEEAFELLDMMVGTALDTDIVEAAKRRFNIEI